jgi:hypothetical protein
MIWYCTVTVIVVYFRDDALPMAVCQQGQRRVCGTASFSIRPLVRREKQIWFDCNSEDGSTMTNRNVIKPPFIHRNKTLMRDCAAPTDLLVVLNCG